jgi:hypothetical protein
MPEENKFLKNVPDQNIFRLSNGRVAYNLESLYSAIKESDNSVFYNHVTPDKSDFANWIKYCIFHDALYERIVGVKHRDVFLGMLDAEIKFLKNPPPELHININQQNNVLQNSQQNTPQQNNPQQNDIQRNSTQQNTPQQNPPVPLIENPSNPIPIPVVASIPQPSSTSAIATESIPSQQMPVQQEKIQPNPEPVASSVTQSPISSLAQPASVQSQPVQSVEMATKMPNTPPQNVEIKNNPVQNNLTPTVISAVETTKNSEPIIASEKPILVSTPISQPNPEPVSSSVDSPSVSVDSVKQSLTQQSPVNNESQSAISSVVSFINDEIYDFEQIFKVIIDEIENEIYD